MSTSDSPAGGGVPRTRLAPDLEISRVVTGLWQVADMERDGERVDPVQAVAEMARYVDAGFTTFDLADHYGSAEDLAGALERARPGAAEFLTKWVPAPGPLPPEAVHEAVARAEARTGRRPLDLLQFHAWRYEDPAWLDAIFELDGLRRAGRIRRLGLTNTDAAHVRMLRESGVEIVSNQVSYSLLDTRASGEMSEICARYGIQLLAYGTLAGGFLTERWVGAPEPEPDSLETWSQMKYKRFIDAAGGWSRFQDLLSVLQREAQRLGCSMANLACRHVLERPHVAAVIVGARPGRSQHLEDNLRIFSVAYDDRARKALEEASAALDPIPGDCGDEYRRPPYLTASGDLSHHFLEAPAPYPVRTGGDGRTLALSGTPWEEWAGYARAVRKGDVIHVSGTTATHRDRIIGGSDARAQTTFCIDKIEGALRALGGRLDDVVRTRVYVSDLNVWEEVAAEHGRRFGPVRPANTLVRADLVGRGYLVEMEAEAIVGGAT